MDTYNKVINSKKIVIIYFYNEECLKTNIIVSKLECNLNDDIVYINASICSVILLPFSPFFC